MNVLSNISFFVCAIIIWLGDRGRGTSLSLLAGLLAACGITGMMWHASEVRIALGLDVAVQLCLAALLGTILTNQILRWPPVNSVMAGIIIVLLALVGRDLGLPFLLQNGGAFLPMMVYLVVLALIMIHRGIIVPAKYLLSSAYMLFIGLIFRSLDWVTCTEFPVGTHWIWHIFMAASATLAIEAVHKAREHHDTVSA